MNANQTSSCVRKYDVVSLICSETDCERSFVELAKLNSHLLSEHNLHLYRCLAKHCGASFDTRSQLTNHVAGFHAHGPFFCEECGLASISYQLLVEHYLDNHLRGELHCTVPGCYSVASNRLFALRHYHWAHEPLACTNIYCNHGTFSSRVELEEHMKGHAADRPFLCLHCGNRFLSRSRLSLHCHLFHFDIKEYICKYPERGCDYKGKTRKDVLMHLLSSHFGMPEMTDADWKVAELLYNPQQFVEVVKNRQLL